VFCVSAPPQTPSRQFTRPFTWAQVEDLLSHMPAGTFVVRHSSLQDHFAFSIRTKVGITNMLIVPAPQADGSLRYGLGKVTEDHFGMARAGLRRCERAATADAGDCGGFGFLVFGLDSVQTLVNHYLAKGISAPGSSGTREVSGPGRKALC
jgi:hypothetical protein